MTLAAQIVRRTGQAQPVEDLEFDGSSDDDGWLWVTLAEQYKCDFVGRYGDLVESGGHFLVTPRKEGPRPLWKNVIIYDTKQDGVELVRMTIEAWSTSDGFRSGSSSARRSISWKFGCRP